MKVTPAKRMLKRAARAKLMVSSASTSCRAVAWSAAGAVVQASVMPLVARPSRVTRIRRTVMPATAATDPAGPGRRETVLDGVGDGDQAAQHEDQAEDDGQVIGDPKPAVGDRAGDASGSPMGVAGMEEVAD